MVNTINGIERAADAPDDPWALFAAWFADAEASEPSDPNAMGLATVGADGRPSLRIVLMKAWDSRGLVFYTNRQSHKGQDLAANPRAALNFHWKTLSQVVRFEGEVAPVDEAESDAYYQSRGRGSRIGAWSSQQSRELANRALLAERVVEYNEEFGATETMPRPPFWGGYRLTPRLIEFWSEGVDRLHTRVVYEAGTGGRWTRRLLFP